MAVYNHYKRLRHLNKTHDDVELSKQHHRWSAHESGRAAAGPDLAACSATPLRDGRCSDSHRSRLRGRTSNIILKLLRSATIESTRRSRGSCISTGSTKDLLESDNPSITRDVSGEGVQRTLLKLIEGHHRSVPPQGAQREQDFVQVGYHQHPPVRRGGAFDGLDKVITATGPRSSASVQRRVKTARTGTSRGAARGEPGDLVKFGLIPELIGRPAGGSHAAGARRRRSSRSSWAEECADQTVPELFSMEGVELEVPAALQA